MLETLVNTEEKVLSVVESTEGKVQIQVKQDGQEAYIDLDKSEVRHLIQVLDNLLNMYHFE